MQTFPGNESSKLWQKYWNDMSEEWFKVEVLQDYTGQDAGPALDTWLAGDKEKSIRLIKKNASQEWIDSCQKKIRTGVKLIRIHVVEEPYTPYVEFEIEHYRYVNIPLCGEQVFLVNKADADHLMLPAGDLMIFDNKRVVVNTYTSNGRMTHQTFYDEDEGISKFLQLKESLKSLAKPFRRLS